MSIASEITRLQAAKAELKTAIENKGVTVPSDTKLDGYADLVDIIEQGGGYEENVWYFCVENWAKYLIIKYNDTGLWYVSTPYGIKTYTNLCWFEFNGEKYYVDNLTSGTHNLTKQGVPVLCNISTFLTLKIQQSGNNYTLTAVED